jgi:SAM-dependent methyltransferase
LTLDISQQGFDRCGIAALSDLDTSTWRELFSNLERDQLAFLAKQELFRTPDYKWPHDALHQWSRAWEYPYVYHHILKWKRAHEHLTLPKLADIGSGVTFFPFCVARLGFHVTCADPDPVCATELRQAANIICSMPGQVDFRSIQGLDLPFENSECDLICCISVLEHIQTFENTVREMHRCLKPGGLLYLTMDLDLQGNSEITVRSYPALIDVLHELFDLEMPERTIHPANMLSNLSGPYPMYTVSRWMRVRHFIKQELIKPILGRQPSPFLKWHLAVQGCVLRKRG